MRVFRCYVEKRSGFDGEAMRLLRQLREPLGVTSLTGLRMLTRYDVEGLSADQVRAARDVVFSSTPRDYVYEELLPELGTGCTLFAVEPSPGQPDGTAAACAQCLQLFLGGERPVVATAKVYAFMGNLDAEELAIIRHALICPPEYRAASMAKPRTLRQEPCVPKDVEGLTGFTGLAEHALAALPKAHGLTMNLDDLKFLQGFFKREEARDPTLTELRMLDALWFGGRSSAALFTQIDCAELMDSEVRWAYERYLSARREVYGAEAETRPQTLWDIASLPAKLMQRHRSSGNSAQYPPHGVPISATVDGEAQDWLLFFQSGSCPSSGNTAPFRGAVTGMDTALQGVLSNRAYPYQAMRVTGRGDPRAAADKYTSGTICGSDFAGCDHFSGVAMGMVSEFYHPAYTAQPMELCAAVGAVPAKDTVAENPLPGDQVLLLRDAVQKPSSFEGRNLPRLFQDSGATACIKRCCGLGRGAFALAVARLAEGLDVNLDAAYPNRQGQYGTDCPVFERSGGLVAIVPPEDVEAFTIAAARQDVEALVLGVVTAQRRVTLRWNDSVIVNLPTGLLTSHGAEKHAMVTVPSVDPTLTSIRVSRLREMAQRLDLATQRGLSERFGSTAGTGRVLLPFGGISQTTPAQTMAALLPVGPGHRTDTCSVMAWGFQPVCLECDPFRGAAISVLDSVTKLVAAGCDPTQVSLSLRFSFAPPQDEALSWGKPFAALLGAFAAQTELGIAAIDGAEPWTDGFPPASVASSPHENPNTPPSLIAFALSATKAATVLSPEFKGAGHPVYLMRADEAEGYRGVKNHWAAAHALIKTGRVRSAWAVEAGGPANGLMKMSFGNRIGFEAAAGVDDRIWYAPSPGGLILECETPVSGLVPLGRTTAAPSITLGGETVFVDELLFHCEQTLEPVYPTRVGKSNLVPPLIAPLRSPAVYRGKPVLPRAVIPVFPGMPGESYWAAACLRAGIEPVPLLLRNGSPAQLAESVLMLEAAIRQGEMMILSGSDGAAGFVEAISALFRRERIADAVQTLLKNRDGLILGICGGFQALLRLGLLPYGEIRALDKNCPALANNLIGRHQSRYVTTRVASVHSPWMLKCQVGDLYTLPIAQSEGRFMASKDWLDRLASGGQIATQYVDSAGVPSMDIRVNPSSSTESVEGLFSPDGRVFGKMAHWEWQDAFLGINLPGNKCPPFLSSGAAYFNGG